MRMPNNDKEKSATDTKDTQKQQRGNGFQTDGGNWYLQTADCI